MASALLSRLTSVAVRVLVLAWAVPQLKAGVEASLEGLAYHEDVAHVGGVDYAGQTAGELLSEADMALREAGFGDCDVALVAMGSDLEASILSAMILRCISLVPA